MVIKFCKISRNFWNPPVSWFSSPCTCLQHRSIVMLIPFCHPSKQCTNCRSSFDKPTRELNCIGTCIQNLDPKRNNFFCWCASIDFDWTETCSLFQMGGNVNRLCFGVYQFECLTNQDGSSGGGIFQQYLSVPLLGSSRVDSALRDDVDFYLVHMRRLQLWVSTHCLIRTFGRCLSASFTFDFILWRPSVGLEVMEQVGLACRRDAHDGLCATALYMYMFLNVRSDLWLNSQHSQTEIVRTTFCKKWIRSGCDWLNMKEDYFSTLKQNNG